jgi:hypothetical protein
MRTTRKALLMLGCLGAVACRAPGARDTRAEESARAPSDSEPAQVGTPIGIDAKLPCGTETVASGDSVAVSFSKDKKLKVEKQTANDTAHHPARMVDCLLLYRDTAHQPGPK